MPRVPVLKLESLYIPPGLSTHSLPHIHVPLLGREWITLGQWMRWLALLSWREGGLLPEASRWSRTLGGFVVVEVMSKLSLGFCNVRQLLLSYCFSNGFDWCMNPSVRDMHGLVLQFFPTLATMTRKGYYWILSGAWKTGNSLWRGRLITVTASLCIPHSPSAAAKLIRNRKYFTLSVNCILWGTHSSSMIPMGVAQENLVHAFRNDYI